MKCYMFVIFDGYGGKYLAPIETCLIDNLFDVTSLGNRMEVDVYEGSLRFFYRLVEPYRRTGLAIKRTGEGERSVDDPEGLMLRLSRQQLLRG